MTIGDVRIRLNKSGNPGPVAAFASFCIDDSFVVHDVRIIESANGLYVAMPSRKRSDGAFTDIAHPANSDVRASLQATILDAYHKEVAAEAENDAQEHNEPWNQ